MQLAGSATIFQRLGFRGLGGLGVQCGALLVAGQS